MQDVVTERGMGVGGVRNGPAPPPVSAAEGNATMETEAIKSRVTEEEDQHFLLNFLNVIVFYYHIKDLSEGFGGSAILEQV